MMAACCEFDQIHDAAPAPVKRAPRPVPAHTAKRALFRVRSSWLAGFLALRTFLAGVLLGVGFWLPVFLTM
jgi:hypothetical protein